MESKSLIFDVKRYSINDGPGIRVTVFFKGCPLSCRWCHNPESRSGGVQKLYSANKCILCGLCVEACPEQALSMTNSRIVTDDQLCIICGACADVCPTKAMEMSGKGETVESIMEQIRKEAVVMETSGGGVTFSGGEPLMHPELLLGLLKACGEEGFHRAVDTCGYASWEILESAARHTDLFLYDLKHMDSGMHEELTGVPNMLILENLQKLSAIHQQIIFRIPLIEGVNTSSENITQTAAFISSLPLNEKRVNLLPYHGIAAKKYEKLGGKYDPGIMQEPAKEVVNACLDIFDAHGILASIGG